MFLCLFFVSGLAQTESKWREMWIPLERDTVDLDSLSIVGNTFQIEANGATLDSSDFVLKPFSAQLVFLEKPEADSIWIKYKVFPMSFVLTHSHKDTLLIGEKGLGFNPYVVSEIPRNENFGRDGLNKSGSITRGIGVGNSQSLSVNSSFQLELSGKIADKVNVLASISDDNIPIQPDGNTAQLQDFDNVFIQLYNETNKLIAGDFRLSGSDGYFLRYRKKAKGANFNSRMTLPDSSIFDLEMSAAASKGKFARNVIQGEEGVQGPYRLTGSEGETFIIVLSGTEQVFVDGRLLKRGQKYDYVIDYNSSEVLFTPNMPITKDRRIIIEFQYSDKNYARSLLQADLRLKREKATFFVSAYGEQDSKNQPLQQELDANDMMIMGQAGDNFLSSSTSGADSVAFTNDAVLYAVRDSLGFDSVYVRSNNPDSAFYRVHFSFVGSGNGDYIESEFTAFGRVFRWIAPTLVDGQLIHLGDHAPIQVLVTPKKRQLLSAGVLWEFGRNEIGFEGAFSVRDFNTFSNLDSQDDIGTATKMVYSRKFDVEDTTWQLLPSASAEYTSTNFSAVERFRAIEFERDWNLPVGISGELIHAKGGLIAKSQAVGFIGIQLETISFEDSLQGNRLHFDSDLEKNGWGANIKASGLQASGSSSSQFLRSKTHLYKKWKRFEFGYLDEMEDNRRFDSQNRSLILGSYGFYDYQLYASQGDSSKTKFRAYYRNRRDQGLNNGTLGGSANAEQFGGEVSTMLSHGQTLAVNFSNRRLKILNSDIINAEPENTLLGRVEHGFRIYRGAISSTTFYEIGSGLEQAREFVYLEVQPGQGTYVWIDYNDDDIKDLNEFEVAQFTYEANYIRTFIPSSEYQRTFTNAFNQTLMLDPARIWSSSEGLKKLVSRFALNTSVRIDRKTMHENSADRFNPFLLEVGDTSLISLGSNFRNSFFFNRTNPGLGITYTFQDSRNKALLTTGFESRDIAFHEVQARLLISSVVTMKALAKTGTKSNSSDFLDSRNYRLLEQSIESDLSWQPSPAFRLSVLGSVVSKSNDPIFGGEQSSSTSIGAALKLSDISKGVFQTEFNYVSIDYTGDGNNSLAFEMLQGLLPGNNFTWTATAQRKVSKNLQLNLIYNGRSSEGNNAIHSGGAQVRAFF